MTMKLYVSFVLFFVASSVGAEMSFSAQGDFYHSVFRNSSDVSHRQKSLFSVAMDAGLSGEKYAATGNMRIARSFEDEKVSVWFGENAYLQIVLKTGSLLVGKKKFKYSDSVFADGKDGFQGIAYEYDFNAKTQLQLVLLDYYSGFALYDFEKFNTEKKNIAEKESKGFRSRHGMVLQHTQESVALHVYFLYMNLGNWGKYSLDAPGRKGDGDYIYHTGSSLVWRHSGLTLALRAELARGKDRMPYNGQLKKNTIDFDGEMISLAARYRHKFWKTGFALFLPDADKKDEAGNILAYGYTGTGNRPVYSAEIANTIGYYPSAWITKSGFHKEVGGDYGSSSVVALFDSAITAHSAEFKLTLARYFLFASDFGNGSFAASRKDFSRDVLYEAALAVHLKIGSAFMQLSYSRFYHKNNSVSRADTFLFSGGVEF